jgi:hypothetical protein
MKAINLLLAFLLATIVLSAQKTPVDLASNLNNSKSNINRLIYPKHFFSTEKAKAFLGDLENAKLQDQRAAKNWVAQNFKRYAALQNLDVQVSFFAERQYKDCTVCKKSCKGRCVQDPGADCVCISHSEPNLRTVGSTGDVITVILLSEKVLDEQSALAQVEAVIAAKKATVKSN